MTNNNPDRYTQGTRVRLNQEAKEQQLGPPNAVGVVTSRYPISQCVNIKWKHKQSEDRYHVDLLDVVR